MNKHQFPKQFPNGFLGWALVFLRWIFGNLILGSIALLVSLIATALSLKPPSLPQDFILGITVLAMTIAATSAEWLDESEDGLLKESKAWLRRITIIVLIVGALLAFVKTPSELLQDKKIDNHIALWVSLGLLLSAVIIGFLSHLVQLKGRDALVVSVISETVKALQQTEDYAEQEKNMTSTIQKISADVTFHNGMRY